MQKGISTNSVADTTEKAAFLNDPKIRAALYQVVTIGMVGLLGYYLFSNTVENLHRQSIATGFGFLNKEASFEVGESLIPYSAADPYIKALLVGVLNTIKVAFIGIVLTVILGTFLGIARLIHELAGFKACRCLYRSDAGYPHPAPAFFLVFLLL